MEITVFVLLMFLRFAVAVRTEFGQEAFKFSAHTAWINLQTELETAECCTTVQL